MCEVSAGVFGFVERGRLRLVLSFVWDGDAGWRPRGRCLMARKKCLDCVRTVDALAAAYDSEAVEAAITAYRAHQATHGGDA